MSNNKKIKLLATVYPFELKLMIAFDLGTNISEVKEYIQNTMRGLNYSFHIGRITNDQDYILLNDHVLFFNNYILGN